MHEFNSVPFIRILPAFCAGILCSFYELNLSAFAYACFTISFAAILFFYNRKRSDFRKRFIAGIFFQFIFFSLGFLLSDLKDERKLKTHISKFGDEKLFTAVVEESPRFSKTSYRLEAEFLSAIHDKQEIPVKGNCYIYIQNDSGAALLKTGDKICFYGTVREIRPPLNPGEFDFKRYASIHRVYHQVSVGEGEWRLLGGNDFQIKRIAEDIRKKFLDIYLDAGLTGQEYAVLAALVLGYDDEIGRELMQTYSATGTLHVLSVSGMHVGLIYTALSFLLAFMERKRELRLARFLILLSALWFYALLTGLSSPVIRSAMMFSFILLGNSFNRTINIYNSLSLSALCIFIFFDPFMLLETGFQLSFIAVAGIAYLYTKVYNLFYFRNYILDKAWSLTSVSVAAQIATLGISIYYFHQFPNYFIPANLLIIPLSTVGIFGGIILLFIYPFGQIFDLIGWLLSKLIVFLNESALVFQELPGAVWNGISINIVEVILLYLLIALLIRFLESKSPSHLNAVTLTLSLILLSFSIRSHHYTERKNIIVFSGTRLPCYQYNKGFRSWLLYHRIDSTRALNLSYNYCLTEDLPLSKRTIICIEDIKNESPDGIQSFNQFILIEDNVIADYTRQRDIQANPCIWEKLSFINQSLLDNAEFTKLKSGYIAAGNRVKPKNITDEFRGRIRFLSEGSFTIDL